MLQVFNFEDDSLPKIRRALMLTASLLVFSVWANLEINLQAGRLISGTVPGADPARFDPSCVLIPILCYLIFRALVTAIWYLPISKMDHVKENAPFKALAEALRETTSEAQLRAKYVAPTRDLEIPAIDDLVQSLGQLLSRFSERNEQGQADAQFVSNMSPEMGMTPPPSELSSETNAYVEKLFKSASGVSEMLKVNYQYLCRVQQDLDELRRVTDKIEEIKKDAEHFAELVKDNVGSDKLRRTLSAFEGLESDIILAAGRKVKIEFWFGFMLPLLWAVFALWLARESIWKIILLLCPSMA